MEILARFGVPTACTFRSTDDDVKQALQSVGCNTWMRSLRALMYYGPKWDVAMMNRLGPIGVYDAILKCVDAGKLEPKWVPKFEPKGYKKRPASSQLTPQASRSSGSRSTGGRGGGGRAATSGRATGLGDTPTASMSASATACDPPGSQGTPATSVRTDTTDTTPASTVSVGGVPAVTPVSNRVDPLDSQDTPATGGDTLLRADPTASEDADDDAAGYGTQGTQKDVPATAATCDDDAAVYGTPGTQKDAPATATAFIAASTPAGGTRLAKRTNAWRLLG